MTWIHGIVIDEWSLLVRTTANQGPSWGGFERRTTAILARDARPGCVEIGGVFPIVTQRDTQTLLQRRRAFGGIVEGGTGAGGPGRGRKTGCWVSWESSQRNQQTGSVSRRGGGKAGGPQRRPFDRRPTEGGGGEGRGGELAGLTNWVVTWW